MNLYYIIMNTSYNIVIIFILFIITIIAIQLISAKNHIEEYRINSGTTKSQTSYSGIDNYKVPSDLNRWPELESMKKVCASYGYTVSDWKSHIDLLVNVIGVPFNIRTETTNNWSVDRYTGVYTVSEKRQYTYYYIFKQWRHGKWRDATGQRSYTYYVNTIKYYAYDITTNKESKDTQYRFAEYNKFIEQVVKNGIKNDTYIAKEQTFNNSSQLQSFTTIEGLDTTNKIKLAKYQPDDKYGVTNNIYDTIKSTGYELSSADFYMFQDKFASNGKTLGEMKQYINTLQKFGINSYVATNAFKNHIYKDLNPRNYAIVEESTLINTYFSKYGLTSVTEFINNKVDGGFSSAVKIHDLHNLYISLFPTNTNSTKCIMDRMHSISSVNIPTMGMNQTTNKYNIDQFFQEFKTKNVSAHTFFYKIYDIYSALKINMSPYNLNQTLHIISAIVPNNLTLSFERLNDILNPQNLNMTFNEYIKLTNILQPKVGFDKNNIVELWNAFKTYYSTIAYEAGVLVDSPVTVDTLEKWFTEIQTYYEQNSPLKNSPNFSPTFFSPNNGDFIYFLKTVLIGGLYKMSDMKRDIAIGMTYPKLISTYKSTLPQQSGFTALSYETTEGSFYSDPIGESSFFTQIYNKFEKWTKYGFQLLNGNATIYEGAETMSQSDANTLNSFGITSFSNGSLRDLEKLLIENNVSQIDPSKTIWTNIMTFVSAMVKIQITNNNLRDFIKLMKDFHAQYIPDWYVVLNKLATIKLVNYPDVRRFIQTSTMFGVYYDKNFDLFIMKLTQFNANFAATGLRPFITFFSDMDKMGYTYNTPQGVQIVNNIIDYFISYKFSLTTYSSDAKLPLVKCKSPNSSELPEGFCHSLVLALFYYNKSSYYHSMYDIRTPSLFNRIHYCNAIDAMQQAYMLCTGTLSYNGLQSVVSQNITIVIPFFYKEEVDAILSDNKKYSNIENRVKIMHDIARAMDNYAERFNTNETKTDLLLYSSLSAVLNIFPAVTFQYFAEDIKSKCGNGNCAYSIYLDPDYTHCKASTTRKTTNYRPSPPVV